MQKLSDIKHLMRREIAFSGTDAGVKNSAEYYNEYGKKNWDNPGFLREAAALITETLDFGFRNDNVFNSIINTVTVGEGETVTVEERSGFKAFWTHRGGQVDQSNMRVTRFDLPRDELAWHIAELEDDIRNGYGDFLASLIPLARMRETAEIHRRVFQLVQAAVPVGSQYHIDATTTGLTAQVLGAAISAVADTPAPSGGTNIETPLTIVGRATAVDEILGFAGFSDATLDEINRTGRLGTYRGAGIVRLKHHVDEDGESFFPEDEVYVLSGNAGQMAFYGGARTKAWTEDKVDYTHFRSRRDLGAMIYRPQGIRRISLDV